MSSISRFATTTEEERKKNLEERIPYNTLKKQKWALSIFREWQQFWKCRLDGSLKVYKDIDEMTAYELDQCLRVFLCEVRKTDGTKYPPKTLKEMVAMLQHYCNNVMDKNWSIFCDKDFSESRKVLDGEMKASAKEGNVKITKRSDIISFNSEEKLWTNGPNGLGTSSPTQLQNTLIYVLSIELGLRAATEHKHLTFGDQNDQLRLIEKDGVEVLQYKENTSKSRLFGIKQARMEPKVVHVLPNFESPERCPVKIYKKFVHYRENVKEITSFYLTPIQQPKNETWFKKTPLGIHQIEKVVKNLMMSIKAKGNFTNTSTRRTAKTRIIASGLPNEVAKKRIGHVSEADLNYIDMGSMNEKVTHALRKSDAQAPTCSRQCQPMSTNNQCNNEKEGISTENVSFGGNFQNCSFNIYIRKD